MAITHYSNADWIVANDVSGDVMGGDANSVHIVTQNGTESWDRLDKQEVAGLLDMLGMGRLAGVELDAAMLAHRQNNAFETRLPDEISNSV